MDYALDDTLQSQLERIPTPWGTLVGLKTDRITQTILKDGQYEWAETAIVGQLLRSGATAIDIGANIGYYTALFARLSGPAGAVHAFEANPLTAALLGLTMAENHWTQVTINNVAAGDTASVAHIKPLDTADVVRDGDLNLGGWSLREVEGGAWEIPVLPLDQYVRDKHIAKVHLVKIDVEGFELRVLQGADVVLRSLRPYLIMEMRAVGEPDRMRCNSMVEHLHQRNYVCCRIMKRPFPHFRVLNERDVEGATFHFNMLALPQVRYREYTASLNGT
jgi:FkbM family methyltransferase